MTFYLKDGTVATKDAWITEMQNPGRVLDQDTIAKGALAVPGTPTVTPQGTSGSATYDYKIVTIGKLNGQGLPSAAGQTTTGNATLDGTNFNRITWTAVSNDKGYAIYRSDGGAAQGLIGVVAAGITTFDDTGLIADGAEPSVDHSGDLSVHSYYVGIDHDAPNKKIFEIVVNGDSDIGDHSGYEGYTKAETTSALAQTEHDRVVTQINASDPL